VDHSHIPSSDQYPIPYGVELEAEYTAGDHTPAPSRFNASQVSIQVRMHDHPTAAAASDIYIFLSLGAGHSTSCKQAYTVASNKAQRGVGTTSQKCAAVPKRARSEGS